MSALFHDVAAVALPVALVLLAGALAAWGALAARLEDAETVRLARRSLDPLASWALVAVAVQAGALVLAGEATGMAVALDLALAAGAVALRIAPEPEPAPASAPHAASPPHAEPPPPAASVVPAEGSLWAASRRPAPR